MSSEEQEEERRSGESSLRSTERILSQTRRRGKRRLTRFLGQVDYEDEVKQRRRNWQVPPQARSRNLRTRLNLIRFSNPPFPPHLGRVVVVSEPRQSGDRQVTAETRKEEGKARPFSRRSNRFFFSPTSLIRLSEKSRTTSPSSSKLPYISHPLIQSENILLAEPTVPPIQEGPPLRDRWPGASFWKGVDRVCSDRSLDLEDFVAASEGEEFGSGGRNRKGNSEEGGGDLEREEESLEDYYDNCSVDMLDLIRQGGERGGGEGWMRKHGLEEVDRFEEGNDPYLNLSEMVRDYFSDSSSPSSNPVVEKGSNDGGVSREEEEEGEEDGVADSVEAESGIVDPRMMKDILSSRINRIQIDHPEERVVSEKEGDQRKEILLSARRGSEWRPSRPRTCGSLPLSSKGSRLKIGNLLPPSGQEGRLASRSSSLLVGFDRSEREEKVRNQASQDSSLTSAWNGKDLRDSSLLTERDPNPPQGQGGKSVEDPNVLNRGSESSTKNPWRRFSCSFLDPTPLSTPGHPEKASEFANPTRWQASDSIVVAGLRTRQDVQPFLGSLEKPPPPPPSTSSSTNFSCSLTSISANTFSCLLEERSGQDAKGESWKSSPSPSPPDRSSSSSR
ncbi:hypothetical protein IE53DRAFT_384898 [Violaceomyces palustris]|uniref:Uncharacterized protein n=1 Tax=Violaceomyces palustris TaxID=1673888 RepID=A0ACD0P3M2_9BASI|nr:hypothetical protein IE53DRAFT_384898 [Violaceomyces palustris]